MNYFILLYDVVDDYVERRAHFRQEHLRLARAAAQRGELRYAGAYADPADGAALVFRGEHEGVARSFAEADPYVRSGIVTAWRVRVWSVVIGADYEGPPPAG